MSINEIFNMIVEISASCLIVSLITIAIKVGPVFIDWLAGKCNLIHDDRLRRTISSLVRWAEWNYQNFVKAGNLKKDEVMDHLEEMFPSDDVTYMEGILEEEVTKMNKENNNEA